MKGISERVASKVAAKVDVKPIERKQQTQDAAEKSRIKGAEEEHRIKEEEMVNKAPAKADKLSKDAPNTSPIPGGAKKWDMGGEETKTAKKEQTEEEKNVEAELNSILKRSPSKIYQSIYYREQLIILVIIFSKTYCPFSKKAKAIFEKYTITPSPFIVELDEHKLGAQLQLQLEKLTGRRTVPNILISGHSIGGGDDVWELDQTGELIKKIKLLGGKRIVEIVLKKQ